MKHIACVLALCVAAPAAAQSRLDPMTALRQDFPMIVEARLDPMLALRDHSDTGDGPALSAEFGGLPDAPGAEETYYTCVACHSTEIIKQQRITDARWDDLWNWMIETQGMIEPEAETRDTILAYLKTHFSSER